MKAEELKAILDSHGAWLRGEAEGSRADLREADLCRADLREADLRWADLRGANIREAGILLFCLGRHHGYALTDEADPMLHLGCERHPLSWWLQNYRKLASREGYSDLERKLYYNMFKLIKGYKNEQQA